MQSRARGCVAVATALLLEQTDDEKLTRVHTVPLLTEHSLTLFPPDAAASNATLNGTTEMPPAANVTDPVPSETPTTPVALGGPTGPTAAPGAPTTPTPPTTTAPVVTPALTPAGNQTTPVCC